MYPYFKTSRLSKYICRLVGYHRVNRNVIGGLDKSLFSLFIGHDESQRIKKSEHPDDSRVSHEMVEHNLMPIHKSLLDSVSKFIETDLLERLRRPNEIELEQFHQAIMSYVRRPFGNNPNQEISTALSHFEVNLIAQCNKKQDLDMANTGDHLYSTIRNLIYSAIGGIVGSLITLLFN